MKGFIEVTDICNAKFLLNIEHIVNVVSVYNETRIFFDDRDVFLSCSETHEEVKEMITKAVGE